MQVVLGVQTIQLVSSHQCFTLSNVRNGIEATSGTWNCTCVDWVNVWRPFRGIYCRFLLILWQTCLRSGRFKVVSSQYNHGSLRNADSFCCFLFYFHLCSSSFCLLKPIEGPAPEYPDLVLNKCSQHVKIWCMFLPVSKSNKRTKKTVFSFVNFSKIAQDLIFLKDIFSSHYVILQQVTCCHLQHGLHVD